MLIFCHNSLSKQLQVDPCDLPMHSCTENRYVNSLIDWQIASGQADITIAVLVGDDDSQWAYKIVQQLDAHMAHLASTVYMFA